VVGRLKGISSIQWLVLALALVRDMLEKMGVAYLVSPISCFMVRMFDSLKSEQSWVLELPGIG
jgi:hypothetical protein